MLNTSRISYMGASKKGREMEERVDVSVVFQALGVAGEPNRRVCQGILPAAGSLTAAILDQ